jgi:outer membrane protein assembly factor BamB
VAIVAVIWLARLAMPLAGVETTTEFIVRILGGFIGAFAVLVWWLFFSRAPWSERLGFLAVLIAALAATWLVTHPSMVVWFLWYSAPLMSLALVGGAVLGRRLASGSRSALIAAAMFLTCAAATPFRIVGVTGNGVAQFTWRWAATAEEQLLARTEDEPSALVHPADAPAPPAASTREAVVASPAPIAPVIAAEKTALVPHENTIVWPGFRGPDRNGVVAGVRINADWATSPPSALWRRDVGPGWSSFAVRNDVFFTQEQRGAEEVVAAYRIRTGEPVWRHIDRARFDEPMGGPGPRGTPTLHEDRVYTFGPTGILNALDAKTGTPRWSRNIAAELGVAVPMWGFASSPVIVEDVIVVAVSGKLAAYALDGGAPRWAAEDGGESYSSPQVTTIAGVPQVLLMSATGMVGIAASDGKLLWQHPWNSRIPIVPIVQPALITPGNLLMGDSMLGVRRVAVEHGPNGWTANEQWISNRLKPYFNDFVVHRGHAYGFDGAILACMDLADGARKWKGGRYGQGQLLLLADQDLLLVLSEEGELVLVKATPEQFTEIARVPALSGKTWNHPVLAGNVLLVRNGEQMAAFGF